MSRWPDVRKGQHFNHLSRIPHIEMMSFVTQEGTIARILALGGRLPLCPPLCTHLSRNVIGSSFQSQNQCGTDASTKMCHFSNGCEERRDSCHHWSVSAAVNQTAQSVTCHCLCCPVLAMRKTEIESDAEYNGKYHKKAIMPPQQRLGDSLQLGEASGRWFSPSF